MKSKILPISSSLLVTLGIAVGLPLAASAAPITWADLGTDFATDGNWDPGVAPADNLDDDLAIFDSATPTNQPILAANRSINGLDFQSGGWTLSGSSKLSLGSGGITSIGDNTVSTTLAAANGSIISSATGGTLTLGVITGNTVTFGTATDLGTVELTGASDNNSFSPVVAYGTVILNKGTASPTAGDSGSSTNNLTVDLGATARFGSNISSRGNGRGQIYGTATINGTMDLNGQGLTAADTNNWNMGGLSGSGIVTNNGSGSAQIGVRGGTFSGTIQDGTSTTALLVNAGSFTLNSSANTYTGGTTIQGGSTLWVDNNDRLGDAAGSITFNNGTLVATNHVDAAGRAITLEAGGGQIRVYGNRDFTSTGVISGAGKLTIQNDGGEAVLSGSNTYSGGTEIQGLARIGTYGTGDTTGTYFGSGDVTLNAVTAGRGRIQNSDNHVVFASNLIISDANNGGALMAGWSKSLTASGVVSGSGNLTIVNDSGVVKLTNTGNTFTGDLFLEGVNSKVEVKSLGGGSYGGDISGTGNFFEYSGPGTQTFSGVHTYTGASTFSGGTVVLDYSTNDSSKLSDTAALTLGATLDLSGGTHSEVVGSTTLLANTGSSVTRSSGTAILNLNAITRNAGATIDFGEENIATTDTTNTNGILGGWATVGGTDWATNSTDGADGLITAYTGPYSDVTRLESGTKAIADGSTSHVRIIEGTGTTPADITLGAPTTTIDTLKQTATGAIVIDPAGQELAVNGILAGAGAGSLTIGNGTNNGTLKSAGTYLNVVSNADTTVNSAIADGTAASSLIKDGSGTLTLNGSATYTGNTVVNAGTLEIKGGVVSDNFTVHSGSTLEFDTSASGNVILSTGTISGDGTLVKSGSGDLILGANGATQLISMTGGLIDVQGGRLRNDYGRGDWSSNLASLNIEAGASVDLWDSPGGISVDALTGGGDVTRYRYGATTTNLTVGVNGGGGTFSGTISDDTNYDKRVALVKEGAGTQILSGDNTYRSGTTISEGTLQIGDGGTTGTLGSGDVVNNAVLAFNRSNTFTLANNISGTGSLELTAQAGQDSYLSGTNTHEGGTTIYSGRFRMANDGVLGATSGTLTLDGGGIKNNDSDTVLDAARTVVLGASGGTMQAGWSKTLTIDGVVEGAGGLTVQGDSGTAILTGANTYTGLTTINNGGTLKLQGTAFSNTARGYDIDSGGVLNLDGDHGVALGTTTISGAGTLRVSGGLFANEGSNLPKGSGRNIAMELGSGALIDIQSGAKMTNGGWVNTSWTNNLASLKVDGTFDLWDGQTVEVDALSGSGIITANPASTNGQQTLIVGKNGGSGDFGGTIQNGNRPVILTKIGAGTQTLSGTNTYTGATTVSAGTLVVDGTLSTSTVTTVNSGATIGGSGTVGALTVEAGGFHNPGNSPGIMTVAGDYTLAGTLTIEITGATAGVGGYDQVDVAGAVDITGGDLVAAFSAGTYTAGDLLFILLNNDTDTITGTFDTFAQGDVVTSYDGLDWTISYEGDSDSSNFTGGNDIALLAIPEPSAALLASLGMLALLRRRRA